MKFIEILKKQEHEDYISYASIVNREFEMFKLSELTLDMFKHMIVVQGLTVHRDAEIRCRILNKLEQDSKLILFVTKLDIADKG